MSGVSDRTPDGYHGGISKDEEEIPVIRELPSSGQMGLHGEDCYISKDSLISIDPGRESLIPLSRYGKSTLSFSYTNNAKKSIGGKVSTVEDKHF